MIASQEATAPDLSTVERCFDDAHRSYSADKRWDECQFRDHAIRDLGVPNTFRDPKVSVGSAVDDAVKAAAAGQAFSMEERIRYHFARTGADASVDQATTKALALFDVWEREVRPTWPEVYATEYEVHFEVAGVAYHAHLDVVFTDGSVIDVKTSDKRLGDNRADSDQQLTTYAAALWIAHGNLAPWVGLDGLIAATMPADVAEQRGIRSKDRPPYWWDKQRSTRTIEQLRAWLDEAQRREAGRRWAATTGIYQTQGRASLYACAKCPAKSMCPSWQGYDLTTSVAAPAA